ncbi:MAG: formate dehydrogenase accessory protein FdhE [Hyphomicrobium sp. SCN 65-11]|nr:MAG: formate dehydrogenase accessory protein FdhE [Hyphomicrobium sp. SCN 65-11]
MDIGEVANPPFAVLPDPGRVFLVRSERFAALAPGHQLEPYLHLLSQITRAQHDILGELPEPVLPSPERLALARDNTMPPISTGQIALDETADRTFDALLKALAAADLAETSRTALEVVEKAGPDGRRNMMQAVILDEIPGNAIAEHVLAAAAVQVLFTRLAARLNVESLKRVADGACPSCGGAPVASAVVGWEGAHGTRFCTCSICATQWNVVRIKCLVCSSEKGIAYHSLEGGQETVMGETCEACDSYVKMLHQHKDPSLEPIADDVASLALDLTLTKEGWTRASVNPFLMGY